MLYSILPVKYQFKKCRLSKTKDLSSIVSSHCHVSGGQMDNDQYQYKKA